MANLTVDVDWQIATTGVTVVGNGANRFDASRQSTTLGPEPQGDGPPPETSGGSAGMPPEAS